MTKTCAQQRCFISNFQIVEKVDNDTFQKHETEKTEACNLKASLHRLLNEINELELNDDGTGTHSGNNIFALLEKAAVSYRLKKNSTCYENSLSFLISIADKRIVRFLNWKNDRNFVR